MGKKRKRPPHYLRWRGMLNRCYSIKSTGYLNYGGRGILVCPEWKNSFKIFQEWCIAQGDSTGKTLDRVNNNGDYSPDNCKFSTMREQASNRRINTEGCRKRTLKRVAGSVKARHKKFGDPSTRVNKHCPKCTTFISIKFFKRIPAASDGLDSYCIKCRRIYDAEYARNKRKLSRDYKQIK